MENMMKTKVRKLRREETMKTILSIQEMLEDKNETSETFNRIFDTMNTQNGIFINDLQEFRELSRKALYHRIDKESK